MNPVDLLLALVANLAWAFNFFAGKVGTEHFQPLFFTSLRFWILLLLLLPWLRPLKGQFWPLLQLGFVLGVLHFGFVFAGLHAAGDISSVAIATQLYVPFSAIMAAIFLREQVGRARTLGICLALGGVLLVGFDPIVLNHLDALGYIVLASLSMALAAVLMKRTPGLGVLRLQAWVALVAAPFLLAMSLLLEEGHWQTLQNSIPLDFWSPFYSAVAASILGHGIMYYLLGRYPVSLTAPLMLLAPILAILIGVLFWGDELSWKLVIGGLLTLAGVLVINVPRSTLRAWFRRRKEVAESNVQNI